MTHSSDSPLSLSSSSHSSLQADDGDSGNASPNDCDFFDFDSINADDLLHVEADPLSIDSSCLFDSENSLPCSPFTINDPNLNNLNQPYNNSPDDGYSSVSCSTDCNMSPVSLGQSGHAYLLPRHQSVKNDVSIGSVVPLAVMGPSLLTVVPVVNSSTTTFCKPILNPQQNNEKCVKLVTRYDANERKYTAQELTKMRNRESARASKEKQKNFISDLQKSIDTKENTIKSLLKQCQEKDSLIEILQEQNKNLMISLAQHQVKLKSFETQKNNDISDAIIHPVKQSYHTNTDASVCPNTIIPMSKTKLAMFVTSPSKRVCLAVLFCFFIVNIGMNIRQEPAPLAGKSVTNRRLLQVNNDDIPQDPSFNQGRSIYGSWDPLHFLHASRRKARNLNENIGYDQLTIPVMGNNSTIPAEECKNHYTNASNSNRIVKQLTQVIEHHQKLTTKSKTKSTRNSRKDPSLELQELFKKTSNPALMKAMYDMLSSWERKDDTVYMFAFGSNEWFLPTSKQAPNSSHDEKLLRPKMSLVMPALNNTEINQDTLNMNEAFKNGNDLSSLLGFYLMQIDCLVVDTHLLTYNNSSSDQKLENPKKVNSLNGSFTHTKSPMIGPRRNNKS